MAWDLRGPGPAHEAHAPPVGLREALTETGSISTDCSGKVTHGYGTPLLTSHPITPEDTSPYPVPEDGCRFKYEVETPTDVFIGEVGGRLLQLSFARQHRERTGAPELQQQHICYDLISGRMAALPCQSSPSLACEICNQRCLLPGDSVTPCPQPVLTSKAEH